MSLLSRLKIRIKLASMVVLSALTVCAIIAVSASLSERRMVEDRVAQLRAAVDLLVGMAETLQDEVTAGKMTLAEAQAQFRQRGRKITFNNGQGYPNVYNADSSVLLNGGNPSIEGKITGATDSNGVLISKAQIDAARSKPEGNVTSYLYPRPGQTVPAKKLAFVRHFVPWNVTMSYGVYVDDLDADVNASLWHLGAMGGGVVALMALLSWLIARDILGALDRQKIRMQRIATGSLDQAVEETERGDEIGRMAETLEMLRQTALTARTLEAKQIATKQQGEQEKREAPIALADRFDTSVGRLVGMMASGSTELEATAQSMTGTAERTNHQATVVSSAAAEASSRVQTVATAAEELSTSISEISRQVAQSSNIAARAVDSARRTDTIVRALADGGPPDRARGGTDFKYRGTDQSARAQRHHRSRARGRCRQRLRGGGGRGQEPRKPDRGSHQGDRHPHYPDPERNQGSRRGHPGNHRHDRGSQRDCNNDRLRDRGTRRCYRGDRAQRDADGAADAGGDNEYRRGQRGGQ
jgi:methyl-accepting chemotaxis protein